MKEKSSKGVRPVVFLLPAVLTTGGREGGQRLLGTARSPYPALRERLRDDVPGTGTHGKGTRVPRDHDTTSPWSLYPCYGTLNNWP